MSALPTINPEKTMSEAQRMNPEIKARWVAALRSGDYSQGQGLLRDDCEMFCCIGVLCDLVDQGAWVRSDDDAAWSFRSTGAYDLPLSSEKARLGLDWDAVEVVIGGKTATLVDHNDTGATFAEIARAIEEQL